MKSKVIQILRSTVIITVNDWHQSCRYLTVKVTGVFFKSVAISSHLGGPGVSSPGKFCNFDL